MQPHKLAVQDLFKPEAVTNELSEYWVTIISKRWLILILTVAAFIGSYLYYQHLPTLYTAQVDILVENTAEMPKTAQGNMTVSNPDAQMEDYYGTQIVILKGRRIAETARQELGQMPSRFRIDASHRRDTRVLSLTCKTLDPNEAARIANKYAEIFVRESAKESTYVTQQMLKWIPEDLEMLENKDQMEKLSTKFNKKEFAESLESVTKDPVIEKMRADKLDLEAKIQELLLRYKPEYPAVVELNEKLEYVDRQLKERTKAILENVRANLAGEINITNVRVLQEAIPPTMPSEPNRLRGVLMGTIVGFFIAIWVALFSEDMNQKIRTEKDLAMVGHLPFLGYVPLTKELLKHKKGTPYQSPTGQSFSVVEVLKRNSVLADAIASVRTRILFSVPYEKSKRIMITSAIPDEGKSTVSALLSFSLTGLGRKILLIDADMRKPFTHTSFNLKNEKGLTDYLVGQATMEEIVRDVEGSTLKVITGGSPTSNPSELLSSDRLRTLLEWAGERFDRVVIDVPPVLFIPDGLVVAKHVHVGVLICGSGMAHRKVVREIKEKFDAIGYSFIGAVINRADYENEGYRYKYFSTYRKYYKKEHEAAKAGILGKS